MSQCLWKKEPLKPSCPGALAIPKLKATIFTSSYEGNLVKSWFMSSVTKDYIQPAKSHAYHNSHRLENKVRNVILNQSRQPFRFIAPFPITIFQLNNFVLAPLDIIDR